MTVIHGESVCGGISSGKLVFYGGRQKVTEKVRADDPDRQWERFLEARQEACAQLERLQDKVLREAGAEEAKIFAAHRMIAVDGTFAQAVEDTIRGECVSAEYAVQCAAETFAELFRAMEDDYQKERAADIMDVAGRIISLLKGGAADGDRALEEPCIVAADDLTPGETAQMDRTKLLGLITRKGAANSHTAILAGTMGIPAVVKAGDVPLEELDGHLAVLDGCEGILYVDPDEETLQKLAKKREELQKRERLLRAWKDRDAVTKDGRRIDVFASIRGPEDVEQALENGAGGIGLFRSEFLYLGRAAFPTEEEQFCAYRQVLERMNGRTVTIRTLDIGADKKADYFALEQEENPALGLRAIRICLTRTDIFRTQLRALYRASVYGNLSVLFPMIASVWEVRKIHEIIDGVKEELRGEGIAFREDVKLGIMIETPAAALISSELAKEADFFSVGTNDLTQYTLAADRQNGRLGPFCDPHHPAVLELIRMTAENAHREGRRVGICGELAGDLSLTGMFAGLGIDELSVVPQKVPVLKKRICECTAARQKDVI